VRATDAAGNTDSSPASFTWTIAELIACPDSTTILSGSLRTSNQVCNNNNTYYEINSTTSGTRTASWYGSITNVTNSLTSLRVTYSGKNSQTCSQTISIWRWSDSTWITLDQRNVGSSETLIANLTPSGTLSSYVSGSSGAGEVRIRVQCTSNSTSFYSSADLLQIGYTN